MPIQWQACTQCECFTQYHERTLEHKCPCLTLSSERTGPLIKGTMLLVAPRPLSSAASKPCMTFTGSRNHYSHIIHTSMSNSWPLRIPHIVTCTHFCQSISPLLRGLRSLA